MFCVVDQLFSTKGLLILIVQDFRISIVQGFSIVDQIIVRNCTRLCVEDINFRVKLMKINVICLCKALQLVATKGFARQIINFYKAMPCKGLQLVAEKAFAKAFALCLLAIACNHASKCLQMHAVACKCLQACLHERHLHANACIHLACLHATMHACMHFHACLHAIPCKCLQACLHQRHLQRDLLAKHA